MRRLGRGSLVLLLAVLTGSCGRTVPPSVVEDAQTAVRVKTALVNDAIVGVRPIEVRVVDGVARLSGSVGSEAEAARAASVARGVDGIRAVEVELFIRPPELDDRPGEADPERRSPQSGLVDDEDAGGGLLSVGVLVRRTQPRDADVQPAWSVGPLVRFGSGRGLGPTIGFGWFGADLAAAAVPIGRLRVRPVMGGLAYSTGTGRVSVSLGLVGGVSFNSVSDRHRSRGPVWALDVGHSLAWRSSASIWIDTGRRTAFHASAGYLVTRPRLRILDGDRVETTTLRADAMILNTGLVYRLF